VLARPSPKKQPIMRKSGSAGAVGGGVSAVSAPAVLTGAELRKHMARMANTDYPDALSAVAVHGATVPFKGRRAADPAVRRCDDMHSATTEKASDDRTVWVTIRRCPEQWFASGEIPGRAPDSYVHEGRRYAGTVTHEPNTRARSEPTFDSSTVYNTSYKDFSGCTEVLRPPLTIHDQKQAIEFLVAASGGDPRRTASCAVLRAQDGVTEHRKQYRKYTKEEVDNTKGVSPQLEERRRALEDVYRRVHSRQAAAAKAQRAARRAGAGEAELLQNALARKVEGRQSASVLHAPREEATATRGKESAREAASPERRFARKRSDPKRPGACSDGKQDKLIARTERRSGDLSQQRRKPQSIINLLRDSDAGQSDAGAAAVAAADTNGQPARSASTLSARGSQRSCSADRVDDRADVSGDRRTGVCPGADTSVWSCPSSPCSSRPASRPGSARSSRSASARKECAAGSGSARASSRRPASAGASRGAPLPSVDESFASLEMPREARTVSVVPELMTMISSHKDPENCGQVSSRSTAAPSSASTSRSLGCVSNPSNVSRASTPAAGVPTRRAVEEARERVVPQERPASASAASVSVASGSAASMPVHASPSVRTASAKTSTWSHYDSAVTVSSGPSVAASASATPARSGRTPNGTYDTIAAEESRLAHDRGGGAGAWGARALGAEKARLESPSPVALSATRRRPASAVARLRHSAPASELQPNRNVISRTESTYFQELSPAAVAAARRRPASAVARLRNSTPSSSDVHAPRSAAYVQALRRGVPGPIGSDMRFRRPDGP